MTKSNKKYGDPTSVFNAVTDNHGRPVEIGNEQDIGEFNETFLSRVQEGLNYKKMYEEAVQRLKDHQEACKNQDNDDQSSKALNLEKMDSSIIEEHNVEMQNEESKLQIGDVEMKMEGLNDYNDFISESFKGKIKQVITYTTADGTEKTKESVNEFFAAILVRVIGFKELYEAWEA